MAEAPEPSFDIIAPIRAQIVRYFALIAGAFVLILFLSAPFRGESAPVMSSYVGLLGMFALAYGTRHSKPALAGALCSLGPFVLVSILVWLRGGITHPAGVTAYVTLVAITGLCWSSRGALVVACLSSAVLAWFLAVGPPDAPYHRVQVWAELTIQVVIISLLVHFSLRALAKSAHNALSHQARFREAIEGSPDAIIAIDQHGVVQLFNQRATKLSNIAADQACGELLSELDWLSPKSNDRLQKALMAIHDGTPVTALELEGPGGRHLEARISFVTHHEDEPNCLIAVRDVTEQRLTRDSRKVLEARIARSQSLEALGRLAGGVAHDFNNMLTVIGGTTELMQQAKDVSPRARDNLQRIQDAATRASKLTSQLLAFGRKQVLQPAVLCPNSTLEQLVPLLERLIPENILLEMQCDPALGNVRADEARLEQVIVNLVSNGRDAMREGGVLRIETENVTLEDAHDDLPSGEYVRITVTDTGEGMSTETHARIFEPFFTTKGDGEGHGLGLAMVHGFVTQSGGAISVESEPGRGSRFCIDLPRCFDEAPASRSAGRRKVRDTEALRVLLVEDEPAVRLATRAMLEALGHTVAEAHDGPHALAKYERTISEFDVLLTDVVMPHMSGSNLAKRLLANHPPLKVLLISGYTEDTSVRDAVLRDGVDFLPKPFSLDALSKKLSKLMASRSSPLA